MHSQKNYTYQYKIDTPSILFYLNSSSPRLLGIISSRKTPAARNVTGSMSGSITLLPLLLPFSSLALCCCTRRFGFPIMSGCHWVQQNGNCRLQGLCHPLGSANLHSIRYLAPVSTNQYNYTTSGPGHPAAPATGYQWIGWTSHYRPTNSISSTPEL